MKDYKHKIGRKVSLSTASALTVIETAISEGVYGHGVSEAKNLFNRPVELSEEGLACAIGAATGGLRSSVFLNTHDLRENRPLFKELIRRRVPLVIHVQLSERYNVDTSIVEELEYDGSVCLFSSSVQDAVDQTVLAHLIAERSLLPIVVFLEETNTVEQVEIPKADLLKSLLGNSDELIDSPTPAQRMIFGKTRRRVPNWFHADYPIAQGIHKSGEHADLENISRKWFLETHLADIAGDARVEVSAKLGRDVHSLSVYHSSDAEYLLLVRGPSWRRARSVVDSLRQNKIKAGCAVVHTMWPFPAGEICNLIGGKKGVAVLERVSRYNDTPLLRSVSVFLDKAVHNAAGKKSPLYPELPAITEKNRPLLYSAQCGVEISSPSASDILSCFHTIMRGGPRTFHLGMDLFRDSRFPKQQIIQQNIRRDYPILSDYKADPVNEAEVIEEKTFGIRFVFGTSASWMLEFMETVTGLVSARFNRGALATMVNVESGQLTLGQESIVEKEKNIDVLITDIESFNGLKSLDFLSASARIVFITGNRSGPVLSSMAERIGSRPLLRVSVSPDDSFAFVLLGLAIKEASQGDISAPEKEIDRLEKQYKEMAGKSWTDQEKNAVFAGMTGQERVEIDNPVDRQRSEDIPAILRKHADEGPLYSRLSHFHDRAGLFDSDGSPVSSFADPLHSLPIAPASTAYFLNSAESRTRLPVLEADACTGCNQCAVWCPQTAISTVIINFETLLKSAVDRLQVSGTSMTQFTPPVLKALSRLASQHISTGTFDDAIVQASEKVCTQMKIEGDRLGEFTAQMSALKEWLHGFVPVVTETFFNRPEQLVKGSGSFFSLTINPGACTACELCVEVCPETAFQMQPETAEITVTAQQNFERWEQLPDTPGDIILRQIEDPEFSPLAALSLSRNYYMSMAGDAQNKQGLFEKILLHAVTMVSESVGQSTIAKRLKLIDELIKTLSDKIQSKLSEALPAADLDSLVETIHSADQGRLTLDTLIGKMGSVKRFGVVETAWIERLALLIKELKTLAWFLAEGPSGTGRARFGMVLATDESLQWANHYPVNPMPGPVVVCEHVQAADFAAGLCRAHIRQVIDNIKLLRRASLEAQNKYDPAVHDEKIAALNWNDLTSDEKLLVPPVFLVTDMHMVSQSNKASLLRLLSSDLPVGLLLLDSVEENVNIVRARLSVLIDLIGLRKSPYFSLSITDQHRLFKGLTEGLKNRGPSFFHLLTPGDRKTHTMPPDFIHRAVESRAFPLVRFKPSKEKPLFSTAIDLSANPDEFEDFVTVELNYQVDGAAQKQKYGITFADWIFCQPDSGAHFSMVSPGPTTIAVASYLALTDDERNGKIPVVRIVNESGRLIEYAVSSTVIQESETVYLAWKTLREIAGMLTPHPERLKETVESELRQKHDSAIEQLRSDFEEKLRLQEERQLEAVKTKLRDKLLSLSGYKS